MEQVKYFNADGTESIVSLEDPAPPLENDDRASGHPGYAVALFLGSILIGSMCFVGTVWAVMSNIPM